MVCWYTWKPENLDSIIIFDDFDLAQCEFNCETYFEMEIFRIATSTVVEPTRWKRVMERDTTNAMHNAPNDER